YNGMEPHDLLSNAARFLLAESPRSFGSAIRSFEVFAHAKSRSRALPTLGKMKSEFYARLRTLPRVSFVRKYSRCDISYTCRLGAEEDLLRERSAAESLALFRDACQEMVSALRLACSHFKNTDDFDGKAFAAHLNRQLGRLPATTTEFTRMLKRLKRAQGKRRNT